MSLFTLGAFATRSAGCIINDMIDKDIDSHVERTKTRPLASGEISFNQAALFLAGFTVIDFGVLFSLNWECIKIGMVVTPLIFIYPTTKRYFKYP
jgi:4-hydroxybenzoate polyprenyltransferase